MITRLTLTDFRNHKAFRISAAGNVALAGANGAGKTNILEAVSLLNGSQGLRRAASADLARFGSGGYAVAAGLADGNEIAVFWESAAAHRKAKINGESAPLSELAEHAGIVWLTPETDLLFMGPPAARRGFLDNLAAGFDPAHAGRAARLGKLMSERAFALKNGMDDLWLDSIENNIVSAASAVADARVRYAAALNHFLENGEIGLSGILESKIINGEKAGDFEDFYRKYLSENRILTDGKQNVDGPHHSDFSVRNAALGLSAEKTSSGQQKLLLNRIVIANAKLLRAKSPDRPLIILLDEADSHLDANARAALFSELAATGAQIWMTGTDAAAFAAVPDCDVIAIDS